MHQWSLCMQSWRCCKPWAAEKAKPTIPSAQRLVSHRQGDEHADCAKQLQGSLGAATRASMDESGAEPLHDNAMNDNGLRENYWLSCQAEDEFDDVSMEELHNRSSHHPLRPADIRVMDPSMTILSQQREPIDLDRADNRLH